MVGVIRSLEAGDLKGIAAGMGNVLETVTIPAYPRILRIKECMEQSGALAALMSGSGPTVFGHIRESGRGGGGRPENPGRKADPSGLHSKAV